MEQRISAHTTLTIVQNTGSSNNANPAAPTPRPAFAKRSGVGGPFPSFPRPSGVRGGQSSHLLPPPRLPLPRPRVIAPPPNRMPPPRSSPPVVATPTTVAIPPELESMYLVTLLQGENRVKIFLSPGKENNHNSGMSKAIIQILEERGLYNKKMNASVHKGLSQAVYDRLVVGGSPFSWIHPNSRKKTTFIVKNVPQSGGGGGGGVINKQKPIVPSAPLQNQRLLPPPPPPSVGRGRGRPSKNQAFTPPPPARGGAGGRPKHVEVIDIDSDEEDEQAEEEEEEEDEEDDINDNLFVLKKSGSSSGKGRIPSKALISTPTKLQVAQQNQTKTNSSTSNKPTTAAPPLRRISSAEQDKKVNIKSTTTTRGVERNVFVVRGKYSGLPMKSIIPPSKSLSCHYRIPDLKKFNATHSKAKLSKEAHPFLGDRFMVIWNDTPPPPQKNAAAIQVKSNSAKLAVTGSARDKRKMLEDPEIQPEPLKKRSRHSSNTSSTITETGTKPFTTTRQRDRGQPPPPPTPTTTRSRNKVVVSSSTSRSSSTRQPPPTTLRQKVREMSLSPSGSEDDSGSSSGSDSSSGSNSSGSGSGSDSEFSEKEFDVGRRSTRRAAAAAMNKKSGGKSTKNKKVESDVDDEPWDLKHDLFKPPPKCFIQAKPCRPIRKSSDGRIYFSLKAKVGPAEHYKNEDLFVNWEKYVRAESGLGGYYKTLIISSATNTAFAMYHMERDQENLVLGRSVEMVSDGTIKIRLQSVDVTSTFMKYINIDTNTHLSCLLTNLLNSHICPGCPNFPLVSAYPEACHRDGVWTSSKCVGVVFHDVDKFISQPHPALGSNTSKQLIPVMTLCPACKELKVRLEEETWELIKLSREYKMRMEATKKGGASKRGRGKGSAAAQKQPLIFGSYKPPSPPPEQKERLKNGIQVRESLSNLFLDFWKELGFKEEEFPKDTTDIKVDTLTEKDFPIIEEDPNPIPGLLPLPESIPILENIDFDENGQTMLTFAEIQLNPYDAEQGGSINIQFINSSSSLPSISSDVIDSLMNSSTDPDGLVQVLAGITENPTSTQHHGNSSVGEQEIQGSGTIFSNPQQDANQDYHDPQYSYNSQHHNSHYDGHPQTENDANSQSLQLHYDLPPSGIQPHNVIDFEHGLDFNLNDTSVESSLMFPTFSLTEL